MITQARGEASDANGKKVAAVTSTQRTAAGIAEGRNWAANTACSRRRRPVLGPPSLHECLLLTPISYIAPARLLASSFTHNSQKNDDDELTAAGHG
jgi:hypothetical protein